MLLILGFFEDIPLFVFDFVFDFCFTIVFINDLFFIVEFLRLLRLFNKSSNEFFNSYAFDYLMCLRKRTLYFEILTEKMAENY